MAAIKLNEAILAKLTSVDPKDPRAGPKPSRMIADAGQRGLMVNVTAAGTKTFHVRWTDGDGKSKRMAIPGGTFPAMRLSVARDRAADILRSIRSEGRDPKAEKKAARAGAGADGPLTVGDLIEAWGRFFLCDKREAYRRDATRTLQRALAAYLGTPAADLSKKMVVALSELQQAAGKRGTARNTIAYVSAMYGWAMKTGRVEANPFLGTPRPAVNKPDRVLSDDEIGAVYAAAALRPYPSGPFAQILMLTGLRRDEVADMEWSELDADLTVLTVPAARMKNGRKHVVHLSEPVRAILSAIRNEARLANSKFVFTTTGERPISGFSNFKDQIDAVSSVTGWRWHDLRHSFSTRVSKLGVSPIVADMVIAHTLPGMMGRYQHDDFEVPRREALDKWAALVVACGDTAMQGVLARANAARKEHRVRSSARLRRMRANQSFQKESIS